MTTQSRHLHRLLSLLDRLLCSPALVVEAHHRPARCLQVGHDEAYSREQLTSMKLHLRHHTPRRLPTGRLIQEALVPDHGLVAWSSGPVSLTAARSLQDLSPFVLRYHPLELHKQLIFRAGTLRCFDKKRLHSVAG